MISAWLQALLDLVSRANRQIKLLAHNAVTAWGKLSGRQKLLAMGAVLATIVALSVFGLRAARGCGSRADVEARVALVSSQLQEAAAQGKLSVAKLAEGIKRLNEASTAYNANADHQAYCQVLNELKGDF